MSATHSPSGSVVKTLRSMAAPLAKTALFRLGGYSAIRRILPSRQLAILRYHAVCGSDGHRYADPGICVTPSNFEAHIRYLTSGYTVLPLVEAVNSLVAGRSLPRNAVALTFDDGYADNLAAARTLAHYGTTATFYITAGCLAGGQPFWPVELRHLIAAMPATRVTLGAGTLQVNLDLTTEAARANAVKQLTKVFKQHPIPVRDALREQLREAAAAAPLPRVMLTWDEVRQMRDLGMTIGSHTMTHPNLPSAGLDAARDELRASRQRLEQETGAPVTMFSYPNGGADRYMTREVAQLVKETGFSAATTSRNAFAGPHSDVFALERIQVSERLEDLIFALEVERFAFQPAPRPLEGTA